MGSSGWVWGCIVLVVVHGCSGLAGSLLRQPAKEGEGVGRGEVYCWVVWGGNALAGCLLSVSAQSFVFSEGGCSHFNWKLVERASEGEDALRLPVVSGLFKLQCTHTRTWHALPRLSPTEVAVA